MRLRHIEVFFAVYSCGSISQAARQLNVSQPSVSKVLQHAEAQLGFTLFERAKGRLVPTPQAHQLFSEAQKVQHDVERLRRLAVNLRDRRESHIRIATAPGLAMGLVPEAITQFRRRRPNTTFEVNTLHHQAVMQALLEERSDVGLVFHPAAHPEIEDLDIARCRFVCVCRTDDDPFPDMERVPLGALDGREFVQLNPFEPLGALLSGVLERENIRIKPIATVEAYYVAAQIVARGGGLSIVDEITARSTAMENVRVRFLEPAVTFEVKATYSRERPPSPAAKEFVESVPETLHALLD